MFSEYILKGQVLLQKFGDLFWKTKLMKRFSQVKAGMTMLIFNGLTKDFLMILVELFLDNLYDNEKYDFWSNNEESEDENED